MPSGFVPDEDQGYIMILVQAPPGASLDYTMNIVKQAEAIVAKLPEHNRMFAAGGFSFAGSAPNQGILFEQLKDFKDRPGEAHSAKALVGQLFGAFSQITGAMVIPFLPPSIQGLGQFGGFTYELLDQSGGRIEGLEAAAQQLIGQGNQTPGLTGLFTQFTASDPQLVVDIDRQQAKSLGMSLGDVTNTMQILLGSAYVNDFDFNSRSYRVYVQADQQFRSNPGDIERYQVRTAGGRMMPLSNIVSVREATAPKSINHYNLFRSAEISGSAAPGYSSGQALTLMEQLSRRALPQGMSFAWSGLSLEEIKAGSQSTAIFGLGLLLVYLTLAGQYESLTLPFIILLSVPLAILGRAAGAVGPRVDRRRLLSDRTRDADRAVGEERDPRSSSSPSSCAARGLSIADAAVEAARIRLRPILMTSLAFVLGVMPLVVASGAGREARHSVGTAVAGGMLASTFLNLLFIPVLYVVVKSIGAKRAVAERVGAELPCAGLKAGLHRPMPGGRGGRRSAGLQACRGGVALASQLFRRRRCRAGADADRARHLRRGDSPRDREEPDRGRGGHRHPARRRADPPGAGGDAPADHRQRHDDHPEHRRRVPGLGRDAAEPDHRVGDRRHADRRRRRLGAACPGRGHQDRLAARAGRHAPADRVRHGRRVPDDHRLAARRRVHHAIARRREGAFRLRDRAGTEGIGQPAERAPRAAAVLDRRRAGGSRRGWRCIAPRRRSAC